MNRIIVPAKYNVRIEIKYDTRTGQSELQMKDGSAPISNLVAAGLLISHADGILKTLITGSRPTMKCNDVFHDIMQYGATCPTCKVTNPPKENGNA